MIGRTLSHYRIIAKSGAGGMGEVYRAEDMKLGREVAFKVLPEDMASDLLRLFAAIFFLTLVVTSGAQADPPHPNSVSAVLWLLALAVNALQMLAPKIGGSDRCDFSLP